MPDSKPLQQNQFAAGIFLLFLAPVFGELLSGHQTVLEFIQPLNFLIFSLPYGFGALLCREFKIRYKKGWLSLLLLALAYGIYEEALVARSVFDPSWSELGTLAGYDYYLGINWTFSFVLIHFHVVISIACSIILSEIVFDPIRTEPWLNYPSIGCCIVGLLLWLPLLWIINPYIPSLVLYGLFWLIFGFLVVMAGLVPNHSGGQPSQKSPHPSLFFLIGMVNMWVIFLTEFFLPKTGFLLPLPLVFSFLVLVDSLTLIGLRFLSHEFNSWEDTHRLALILGFLSFFMFIVFFSGLIEMMLIIISIILFYKLFRLVVTRQEESEIQ